MSLSNVLCRFLSTSSWKTTRFTRAPPTAAAKCLLKGPQRNTCDSFWTLPVKRPRLYSYHLVTLLQHRYGIDTNPSVLRADAAGCVLVAFWHRLISIIFHNLQLQYALRARLEVRSYLFVAATPRTRQPSQS